MSTRIPLGIGMILVALALTSGFPRAQAQATLPSFAPVTTKAGVIYVSGIRPWEGVPSASLPDDIRVQTAVVLDELSARLKRAGSSLDRVLTLHVYLKRAGDFAAMNEVWSKFWPKDPPSRTTVIAETPAVGALIQVSAIAAAPGATREVIRPKAWIASPSPYSYAVRSGDTLYLAGLVARNGADNTFIKGDITVQTKAALENARAILGEAGYTFDDVVSSRVFLTDVANFAPMNDAYRTAWAKDPPARATVITGLMSPDYLVEISLTAVKGGARNALTMPGADGKPGQPNPNLSSAIAAGGRLFLSGMLGIVPGAPPDARQQARELLTRLGRTMAAGGVSWTHVVDSVVYVTEAAGAPAALEAFREQSGGTLPTGSVVVTGLVSAEGRVEIMLTAGK